MERRATPEHSSTEFSQENMAITPLSVKGTCDSKDPATEPTNTGVRDYLRHNRLQVLGKILRRWLNWTEEPRKIVLHRSRKLAAWHCLLHLVPLSGAVTLLVLRFMNYWVGSNPPNLTKIQFAAKIHELLMQISIVEIMLCIVRTEAIFGYVPLGALSGALQPTQLSYLWSLDFWSMLHLDKSIVRERRLRRLAMAAAIPVLLILTAVVGPSSAVLMFPQPGMPMLDRKDTTTLGPLEYYFPSSLDYTRGLNMTWANFNETLRILVNPKVVKGEDEVSFRTFDDESSRESVLRTYSPNRDGVERGGWTMRNGATATMPTTLTTRIFEPYPASDFASASSLNYAVRNHYNITASVIMPHPVVQVQCFSGHDVTASDDMLCPKDSGDAFAIVENLGLLAEQVPGWGVQNQDSRKQMFGPVWGNSPEQDSQNLLVWVFHSSNTNNATLIQALDHKTNPNFHVEYVCCSVSAYWNVAEMISVVDREIFHEVSLRLGPVQTEEIVSLPSTNSRRISLNITGLNTLWDPQFMWMLKTTSIDKGLAAAFALALAEVPTNIAGPIPDTWSALKMTNETLKVTARYTMYGYGYSTDPTSIRLSIAVILAYSLAAVAYMVYILITGSTSTSWNSAVEIVALALQSKKPEYPDLGHTAAGIDSLGTLRQNVGIRVNRSNELELVFASDKNLDRGGLRKIERNRAY
ncbi:hypothetical protein DE146DRAFT_751478 [Phaeosphaeria sp. MPI-PUGE-AT-0046c]|nr:hypothetical protein DE146DRAFT_751478 [Phaeosphaeria sp. MPI-PUGE-AT-0046c]